MYRTSPVTEARMSAMGSAGPRWREPISRCSSSSGSRNVPVHVPPCQMLNTAMPVSEYQLRRMLLELPRTSKKTSPSRGSGAASEADMQPMVACPQGFVQFVTSFAAPEFVCSEGRKKLARGISPPCVRGA